MQPRPLPENFFSSASGLLADSFYLNPAHIYICPVAAMRHKQLKWMLGANLRLQIGLGVSTFCKTDDRGLAAMGYWTRADSPGPSFIGLIRAGLLSAPFRLGVAGVRRMSEVSTTIDDQLHTRLGTRPFWHLNNMVVREDLRGSGVGTQLLEQEIEGIGAIDRNALISLATQRPENVKFYRRLGFAESEPEVVGIGPKAFPNWIMVRELVA